MEKKIPINTDIKKFYKQYLNILKPLLKPYLKKSDLNVLAELMYLEHKYSGYDDKVKAKMMFDYDTKMDIIESLDISQGTLYNSLFDLRKKGYLNGNKLNSKMFVKPKDNFTLTFKFNIEDE